LHDIPIFNARVFNCDSTEYSSFGIDKLARTNFGFLIFAGLTASTTLVVLAMIFSLDVRLILAEVGSFLVLVLADLAGATFTAEIVSVTDMLKPQ
jgi:hypothetical protein